MSAKKVKQMEKDEIESGKISTGQCINPNTYVHFIMKNGIVSTSEFTVEGGKHNLYEIREKLLTKHRKLTHLNPDEYFDSLSISELQNRLSLLGELDEKMGVDEMKKLMKN